VPEKGGQPTKYLYPVKFDTKNVYLRLKLFTPAPPPPGRTAVDRTCFILGGADVKDDRDAVSTVLSLSARVVRPTNSSFFQLTARNSENQLQKQFRIRFPEKQSSLNSSFEKNSHSEKQGGPAQWKGGDWAGSKKRK
jgi:hypothetical protein